MRRSSAKAHEILGSLVLLDLGISMTGFHDGARERVAVAVFERGRWDRCKARMKIYTF